jgi:hypothetical protein
MSRKLSMKSALLAITPLLAPAALPAPCPGSEVTSSGDHVSTPYNVLLYVVDTLRADHLGLYGYSRDTSPFLDQIATEGARWRDFHSASTWTWPSVASMISGVSLPTNRCDDRTLTLHPNWRTLPRILEEQGYTTTLISSNATLWTDGRVAPLYQEVIKPRRPDQSLTNQLATLLRDPNRRPFLIHAQPFGVHTPYFCPSPYDSLFIDDPFYGGLGDVPQINPASSCVDGIAQAVVIDSILSMDWYVSQYDGLIAYMDWQLEQIFAVLEQEGLRDSTLVIITSDHGENLAGEHGYYFCHSDHYESNIHVPLVVIFPEQWQAEHGPLRDVTFSGPSNHIDLLPTILDVLGLEPPAYLQGRDLIQHPSPSSQAEFDHTGRIYQDGRYKIVNHATIPLSDPFKELYDLLLDPQELSDLAAGDPTRAATLEEKLNAQASAAREEWPPLDDQAEWSFFSDLPDIDAAHQLFETDSHSTEAQWSWVEVGGNGMLRGQFIAAGAAGIRVADNPLPRQFALGRRGPERGSLTRNKRIEPHRMQQQLRNESAAAAAATMAHAEERPDGSDTQGELGGAYVAVIAPPLYRSRAEADIKLQGGWVAFEIGGTIWGGQRYRLTIEENQLTLQRFTPLSPTIDYGTVAYPFGLGAWRHVRLEATGRLLRVLVDEVELFRGDEDNPSEMWGTTFFKVAEPGSDVYVDNISVEALPGQPYPRPPFAAPHP